jgi:hypothetical protein
MVTKQAAAIVVAAAAACGGSSSHSNPDGPSTDAPPGDATVSDGLSRCDASAAPHAMLVAISADDAVDLYQLTNKFTSTGIRLKGGFTTPSHIVMRDDGVEALAVYGGFGMPTGVLVISVAPDGSNAQLAQVIQISTTYTGISVDYADHDHAVLALEGTSTDQVVGLTRQTNGFVAGPMVAAPADYPLQVAAHPGRQDVLYSRSQVGVDLTLDIYTLQESGNSWHAVGSHASVADQGISIGVHPTGNALYVPTGDPKNPVSSANLNAPGLLHTVQIGTGTFTEVPTIATPRVGALIAVDPGAHFVVVEGTIYMLDAQNNPNAYAYDWQTIRIGTDYLPTMAYESTPPVDGLLFDDIKVAPSGHLVAARELYPNLAPPGQQYPLELWAQPSWGAWQLCDTAYLTNGAHVAISP